MVEIGTQYKSLGKAPRLCTVVDVYRTYNNAGTLVKTSYVCTHEFMGQTLTEYDVPESLIVRGLLTQTAQGN